MFGYVLPEKPEMKIKEYELFRAFYCGVCKSIGQRFGQVPRLTLNYDTTFLAILLHSLTDKKLFINNERCIVHPFKKHKIIRENDIIDYAADINIILAYYNLEDNWDDDKSMLSGTAMLMLKRGFRKLKRKYSVKCDIIESRLSELRKLEKEKCESVDRVAEPFAKIMEEVLLLPSFSGDEKNIGILKWLGYNLGKWIYVLDAYDDINKDAKNKSYNPLLIQYGYHGQDLEAFKDLLKERVEFNLTYSLSEISKAYELLDTKNNSGIIENIIYMGMLCKTEQILAIRSCKKVEKSV